MKASFEDRCKIAYSDEMETQAKITLQRATTSSCCFHMKHAPIYYRLKDCARKKYLHEHRLLDAEVKVNHASHHNSHPKLFFLP